MVNPIPDNVKEVLAGLTPAQQVTIRAYIAALRDQVKEYQERDQALQDPDPHAHYHGHEKCTSDHGHEQDHGEPKAEHHGHEHGHKHHDDHHEHGHDHHDDRHDHHEHEHKHHEHKHEHHHHDHAEKEDDIPAWKKKALESGSSDPMAAPFGGSWNTEASVSATDSKKEG